MTKREKLSKNEIQSLQEFVGKCVMENVSFPPVQVGANRANIQEIMHNRSIESLGTYNDFLEKQSGKTSRVDRINGTDQEKKIDNSSVTYTEAVNNIDLIIKHKLYSEYKEKVSKRLKEINEKLNDMQSPAELKAKLKKEQKALESI